MIETDIDSTTAHDRQPEATIYFERGTDRTWILLVLGAFQQSEHFRVTQKGDTREFHVFNQHAD